MDGHWVDRWMHDGHLHKHKAERKIGNSKVKKITNVDL